MPRMIRTEDLATVLAMAGYRRQPDGSYGDGGAVVLTLPEAETCSEDAARALLRQTNIPPADIDRALADYCRDADPP